MLTPKTSEQIEIMRQGGRKLARIRQALVNQIKPGITTGALDQLARDLIARAGGTPSFLGYHGYPAAICTSLNDEIVHGVPNSRQLNSGDIIGLDVGLYYRGFHTDTAITVGVGPISPECQHLISITKQSLAAGIAAAKPGAHLGDIQSSIQKVINAAGMGIVRDLTGHGIGRELQEPPSIPNFGRPNTGPVLKVGMTLAIEPMVTLGSPDINILADGWTITTADGLPAAHFEHTIAITAQGAIVLTQSS